MPTIQARCRVCGRKVKYFGDLCADDEGAESNDLERADSLALADRQSREDY